MDVFAAVTAQWLAVAGNEEGRAEIKSWAQRQPSLGAYDSPAHLVAAINEPGHPERSCTLLADLLRLADNDPLAQLAVLRAVLPGLRRAVHQRWKAAAAHGPWSAETDLAADAISTAWEAIRHHAGTTHSLPARLIIRRVERRLRTIHDAERREMGRAGPVPDIGSLARLDRADPDEEERFADELLQAVISGRLDQASAATAYRICLLREPAASAGRHHLDPGQTGRSLRLVLDVLAGAARAPYSTDGSRPVIHAPIKEDSLVPSVHQPPDHGSPPTAAIMPLLLTVNQAAKMLGIGRSTLYQLIDDGEIPSVKVGASRRIPLKTVHEFIDELLGDHHELHSASQPTRRLLPERGA